MAELQMAGESFGKAAQVADGFWVIATQHHPGGSKRFPAINNRCLVFRLEDKGMPLLLVINGVAEPAIAEVKRLEKETATPVKYILSPGGGHHFLMAPWHDAFEFAHVLLPPERIPRTATGKKLLQLPRVSLMNADNPLPQFQGQLDVLLFRGLYGMPDHQAPGEGGSDSFFALMGMMMAMMFKMKDPIDELWVHHRASGTVIGGENLGWMYRKADLAKMGMMKGMLKPDQVYVFKDARKVADPKLVSSCWKTVLDWNPKNLMTYHDVPGHAHIGEGGAALRSAVQAAGQL